MHDPFVQIHQVCCAVMGEPVGGRIGESGKESCQRGIRDLAKCQCVATIGSHNARRPLGRSGKDRCDVRIELNSHRVPFAIGAVEPLALSAADVMPFPVQGTLLQSSAYSATSCAAHETFRARRARQVLRALNNRYSLGGGSNAIAGLS